MDGRNVWSIYRSEYYLQHCLCALTYSDCRELENLLRKVHLRRDGPWYKRLIRSTRDEETLRDLRTDLGDVVHRYQVGVLFKYVTALFRHMRLDSRGRSRSWLVLYL